MLKNLIQMTHLIEAKAGHFLCEHGTTFAEAKEMLLQFLKQLGQMEDQAAAAQAIKPAEESPPPLLEPTQTP
jgi:hypothetical protein